MVSARPMKGAHFSGQTLRRAGRPAGRERFLNKVAICTSRRGDGPGRLYFSLRTPDGISSRNNWGPRGSSN